MQKLSKYNWRLWNALRENVWPRFATLALIYIPKLGLPPLRPVKFCWCKSSARLAVNQVQYLQEPPLNRKGQRVSLRALRYTVWFHEYKWNYLRLGQSMFWYGNLPFPFAPVTHYHSVFALIVLDSNKAQHGLQRHSEDYWSLLMSQIVRYLQSSSMERSQILPSASSLVLSWQQS